MKPKFILLIFIFVFITINTISGSSDLKLKNKAISSNEIKKFRRKFT